LGADGDGWDVPDPSPNPEQLYAQHENEKMLKESISELRPTIRQVVEIQQLQEIPMKEAATMIGVSVTAAKARLFHGRRALRKAFGLRTKLVEQA
jgi:DNA-directed RNA polymerase specialized sigma24 family protein